MNTIENYKQVLAFGKNIIEEYKSKSSESITYSTAVMTLEHLERVLDLGRVLMSEEAMGGLEEVHTGLQELRGHLRELVAKIDREELQKKLDSETKIFNQRILL